MSSYQKGSGPTGRVNAKLVTGLVVGSFRILGRLDDGKGLARKWRTECVKCGSKFVKTRNTLTQSAVRDKRLGGSCGCANCCQPARLSATREKAKARRQEIAARHRAGETIQGLAAAYGVSAQRIGQIVLLENEPTGVEVVELLAGYVRTNPEAVAEAIARTDTPAQRRLLHHVRAILSGTREN